MDRSNYARSNRISNRPYYHRKVWNKNEKRLRITMLVILLNLAVIVWEGTTNPYTEKCLCVLVGLVYPAYSTSSGSYRQRKSWRNYWPVFAIYVIITLIINAATCDSLLYWFYNLWFLSWCVDNRSDRSFVQHASILVVVLYVVFNINKEPSVDAPYEIETQFTSPVMENGTGMCPAWAKTLNEEFHYMHQASKEVNN